ncbi:hypothetical protein G6F16_000763 [Rhizopus arrhizus]|uniref:Uncharacterized protein n=1 Tax=Rhizopus oryzae TaxID=64495 RepID=A0A9P6X8Y0_RHIOR|nr:hypothetical protein G6F23_002961 [Rhizopus arrhizus]KAG0762373.1 hypothetical protein G6F24_006842 [Rhizopus arrhizus]KAG0782114.1 hypothetical protein G6F22_009255 [Rhizopus arrhizus]KAG0788998.1 hypothetical protein G6F21_006812 [Rhizopus arrhizus]KAG0810893.1 hypothetical protein G6F20_007590 [Rhizopus arrhizus]
MQTVLGFCFYNHADSSFYIIQKPFNAGFYFKRFTVNNLKSGDSACCNFQNTDCVKSKKSDDIAWFVVQRHGDTGPHWDYDTYAMTVPAGGWMEFHGSTQDFYVKAYWADGSEYSFVQDPDWRRDDD